MKKINEKLKSIALVFCILYTVIGLLSQTVKVAWALDEWDIKNIVEDEVSSKISSYDYDFKREVKKVVEDVVSSKISAYDWDFKSAVESIVENCDVDSYGIDC